jgi:hypothetical protein
LGTLPEKFAYKRIALTSLCWYTNFQLYLFTFERMFSPIGEKIVRPQPVIPSLVNNFPDPLRTPPGFESLLPNFLPAVHKEGYMRKVLFVFIAVTLLSSCSNPVLKWIDTPADRARLQGNNDKEITSFTFGMGPERENDLPIGKTPDHTGKFPISVILSGVSSLNGLKPDVRFIGKDLSPRSKMSGDFGSSVSSPVVYTVTAANNSTRDYGVRVYLQNESSHEIVRFAVDTGQGLSAEGIINQEAGTVIIDVPAGTDTGHLTAHIVHTGQTVRDSANRPYAGSTFDMSGDFSAPGIWTVIARDGGTKNYTVTVNMEKSDAKEITSFSFHLTGEEDIIGAEPRPDGKYPILVVLSDTDYKSLPSKSPFIHFIGASLSPEETSSPPPDFTSPAAPVTYTVAAENGSTRDYAVTVISKEVPAANEAEITGFYLTNPLTQGIIDQTANTITLTVPEGTDLRYLRPEIYYKGASVSPKSGQPQDFTDSDKVPVEYTVRAPNGILSKTYKVSVYPLKVPPTVKTSTDTADVGVGTDTDGNYVIVVDYPIHIENPVIYINYPGSSQTININDFNPNQNIYFEYVYINDEKVVVINPPADPPGPPVPPLGFNASIDYFYLTDPAVIGVIDTGAGTGTETSPIPIKVTVPYGTDLQNLKPAIIYTGREIGGIPGSSPLKDGPRSFQTPVDYVVIAENDTEAAPNRKYYRVTVTPGAPNNAKEITAFSFVNVPPVKVLISGVANGSNTYPIEITVPKGTNRGSLTPVITHTGFNISGPGGITGAGPATITGTSAASFTSPVSYTVTAQDRSTRTYTVTVREEADEVIEIEWFYFTEPLAVGNINQDANTITVTVPSGTNRANLRPMVYFTGMALSPGSGTANNFTSAAAYTVTGASGKTRTYSVVVNSVPSTSKDITRFKLSGVINSDIIIGAVPDADGLYPISVQVPEGTDLAGLGAEISHTGVSISPEAESPRNFNSPQNYTVTAEDGSVKTYKVMVHAANPDAKLITSLIFNAVPLSGGGTVRVVASIDQTGKKITAAVPQTASINRLRPTITYIGKSIRGPGGRNTANPFTDAERDFSGSQTYTVEAQNDSSVPYSVTVIRQSGFEVAFEGEAERGVINTNSFDQTTGIITVTIKTSEVDAPYSWYINGVIQGVSDSDPTFTLNIGNGSFYPGRYEIMAVGMKDGLRYTGKVYFVVSGGA